LSSWSLADVTISLTRSGHFLSPGGFRDNIEVVFWI
jgi:hypothetical protein